MSKPVVPCRICQQSVDPCYDSHTNESMVNNQLCFSCNFWYELVKIRDGLRVLRTSGWHYFLGDDDPRTPIKEKGYAGEAHYIRFNDGRLVRTTDLRSNGQIPAEWSIHLPANGAFIQKDEFERLLKGVDNAQETT